MSTFAIEDTTAQFAIEDTAGDTVLIQESVYRGAIRGPQGEPGTGASTEATDVAYTPAESGDWAEVPAQVAEALDELAGRSTVADSISETGTGVLGLTGLDALIHGLTSLTAADVDGGSTLTLPATVKTSSVTLGQFGRVQWVNPDPPASSQRLVGARVTVTCGTMVNAVQVVGVGNTDGTATPNNQRVVSSTASGGFAGEGDFCYRFGSAGGCTQVLEFAILSDAAPGDLGVVVASGPIAPGATVPDITLTSIVWLYADAAIEARVNAVSQAIVIDYSVFGNVDITAMADRVATCDHPAANGSQFLLYAQTDGSERGIYTYSAGSFTKNYVQPSDGVIFSGQGLDADFTDLVADIFGVSGCEERFILTTLFGGSSLHDQLLPNGKQTSRAYGPGTFPTSDSVMIRRHRPTADGDSITTIGPLDNSQGIVAGRQYTFIDESDDPSHRTILDCSDNNVSGQSEIIVPYHGGVVIYADDIAGEWVLIDLWGGTDNNTALNEVGLIATSIDGDSGFINAITDDGSIVPTDPNSVTNTNILLTETAQTVEISFHVLADPVSAADGTYICDGGQFDPTGNVFAVVSNGHCSYTTLGGIPVDGSVTAAKFATDALDTDGTLAADSDERIASQKAVKTYVDANASSGGATPSVIISSGRFSPSGVNQGSSTLNSNRLYYVPIVVYNNTTFANLAINHAATTAGSGSVVRLGIYADSGGLPGARILDAGTVALDTAAAFKALATPFSQALTAGIYWLAMVPQITSLSPTFTIGNPTILPSTSGTSQGGMFQNGVTGTLPSTASPDLTTNVQPPLVYLKAA